MKQECVWERDGDPDGWNVWETGCGQTFCLDEDGPTENGMNFCPFCGNNVKEMGRDK